MIRTPPQHNTVNPPGQILYTEKINPMAYKSHPKTLGDIIDNVMFREKQLEKKKLTFEEWLSHHYPTGFENFDGNLGEGDLQAAWKAAQENK